MAERSGSKILKVAGLVCGLAVVWHFGSKARRNGNSDSSHAPTDQVSNTSITDSENVSSQSNDGQPMVFSKEQLGQLPELPATPLIGQENFRSYVGAAMLPPVAKTNRNTKISVGNEECEVGEGVTIAVVASRFQYYIAELDFACKSASGKSITEGYIPRNTATIVSNRGY